MANVPAHGGLTFATQHDAPLAILHPSGDARLNLVLGNLLVVDLAIGTLGYQALLGRDDLLNRWLRPRLELAAVVERLARHNFVHPIRHGARVELPPTEF